MGMNVQSAFRMAFPILLATVALSLVHIPSSHAAEADLLNGFTSPTVKCPAGQTGVAHVMMANPQGERRLAETTYQSGIATLVALSTHGQDEKNTLLIALDPKTDPNPLAGRLAALTSSCFPDLPVVKREETVTETMTLSSRKRPRAVVRRHRAAPFENDGWGDYPGWTQEQPGGCPACALFGNHGR
jgi:hypothetical protein